MQQGEYVADWSVNKHTFEEFHNFLVDLGFDVSIDGYSLVAKKGSRKLTMFKGFKCSKSMMKMTKRFRNER